ncbi:hypothetical protein [Mesoplasma lactucae]|uniref:Uncharacterized protein n=1 Tax=Mesoplasma lactucae ATCC 49193 TaxID=81460 RepID=A0A291IQW6_9MOLU|nr:hypothetical protein [Mesoplasma lactucae]ATG97252.1 hypothetical protein CP520_00555 [Mesoplasma lactucae ATCC 49193]ATZ20301.1 hypothetical protein MLACT_v1c04800 [Mesoplasma lactucae ATCC 49193]MCL8216472.1 hypothetical protein [Mesoplasma lactucae ATCC 49193]
MKQQKPITLTYSTIPDEKDALDLFKHLDKVEKDMNKDFNKEEGFEAIFREKYQPFKEDKDLQWSEEQPLVIRWSLRMSLEKPIKDIMIDKTDSINQSYEEYMKTEDHFDYTLIDEIVNRLKDLVIDVYEKHIPFSFNELFEAFREDQSSFGFDLYQLNAVKTSEGHIFIIDTKSAEDNGILQQICEEVPNRIKLRRR